MAVGQEWGYVDFKEGRCPGYQTLGAHVYHPLFQKTVTLAIMECEDQKTETVALFFNLFNEMLRDYTGDPDYKFNPSVWIYIILSFRRQFPLL